MGEQARGETYTGETQESRAMHGGGGEHAVVSPLSLAPHTQQSHVRGIYVHQVSGGRTVCSCEARSSAARDSFRLHPTGLAGVESRSRAASFVMVFALDLPSHPADFCQGGGTAEDIECWGWEDWRETEAEGGDRVALQGKVCIVRRQTEQRERWSAEER